MKLIELLSFYDQIDKKGFDFFEIVYRMRELDESDKELEDTHFERIAFSVVPSKGNKGWGYYYGPHYSSVDKDGKVWENPSLTEISPETVHYWEKRYSESHNPLLKMRYAGLVYDFKKGITGEKSSTDIYKGYLDNMIIVCEGDYCRHPFVTVDVLERLFSLAKTSTDYLKKAKHEYIDFEKRHSTDTTVRYWASRFRIMINNKKFFTAEEVSQLVAEHEARLERLSTPDTDGSLNPWVVENQADLLAEFYKSGHHTDDIKRVLKKIEDALIHQSSKMDPLSLAGNMEQLYHKYCHYNLHKEARRLEVDIQIIGKKAKETMRTVEMKFSVNDQQLKIMDKMFGQDAASDKERWQAFAITFIPNYKVELSSLQESLKEMPTSFLIGTSQMDYKGRPLSKIGNYDSDPDGQLVRHMTERMQVGAFLLVIAINKMIEVGCFTVEQFIDYNIKPSPAFEERRYVAIKRGIESFLSNDFLTACHLLIPQIESAVREIVELCQESVIERQKNAEGFQLQSLDALLRHDCLKEVFSEDIVRYFRLVLTDQRSLNLRNSICHGSLLPSSFDVNAASRLIHVLVLLGQVRWE